MVYILCGDGYEQPSSFLKRFCHKASTDGLPGQVSSGLLLFWNSFLEPLLWDKESEQMSKFGEDFL